MMFCWSVHFSEACCTKWEVQRHQTKRCYCKGPPLFQRRKCPHIDEFEHLILFVLLRTKPGLLCLQLNQALEIRDSVFEDFSHRMIEDEMENKTLELIIGTDILFGIWLIFSQRIRLGWNPMRCSYSLLGEDSNQCRLDPTLVFLLPTKSARNCWGWFRLAKWVQFVNVSGWQGKSIESTILPRYTWHLILWLARWGLARATSKKALGTRSSSSAIYIPYSSLIMRSWICF